MFASRPAVTTEEEGGGKIVRMSFLGIGLALFRLSQQGLALEPMLTCFNTSVEELPQLVVRVVG